MNSRFPSRLDENISSDTPVRLVNQIVDELDAVHCCPLIRVVLSCVLSSHAFGCCSSLT